MNDHFEADLKEAFTRYAAGVPAESVDHLRRIDYHPRTSRVSPRLTVGAVAGATATAGAIVSVVVLGGAPAAFAGWRPSPTPSARETAAVGASCQTQLSRSPTLPGTAGGAWQPVVSDVRGPFTMTIYQDGTATATCLSGPSFTFVNQSADRGRSAGGSMSMSGTAQGSGQGASSSMIGGNGSGAIPHFGVAHVTSSSQGPYTFVEGQVAAGVIGVTLVRSDGDHVEATTADGWFVAWWPGSQGVTSAEVTTAGGATTQPMTAQPPATQQQPPSTQQQPPSTTQPSTQPPSTQQPSTTPPSAQQPSTQQPSTAPPGPPAGGSCRAAPTGPSRVCSGGGESGARGGPTTGAPPGSDASSSSVAR